MGSEMCIRDSPLTLPVCTLWQGLRPAMCGFGENTSAKGMPASEIFTIFAGRISRMPQNGRVRNRGKACLPASLRAVSYSRVAECPCFHYGITSIHTMRNILSIILLSLVSLGLRAGDIHVIPYPVQVEMQRGTVRLPLSAPESVRIDTTMAHADEYRLTLSRKGIGIVAQSTAGLQYARAVSYTHLTLPTICSV